jgi:hypothetical protein
MGELENPHKVKLDDQIKALEADPVAYSCAELKASRLIKTIGEYVHEDGEITNFVNDNLQNLVGNFDEVVGELASALPFGFCAMEIVWKTQKIGKRVYWRIKEFRSMKQDQVAFQVKNGNVTHIKYNDGGIEKWIPMQKVVHVANGFITKNGAKKYFGNPELKRAYPYIRLKSLIFSELGVSAKRTATGFLHGKADSNKVTQLLDSRGKPIPDGKGGFLEISHTKALQTQFKNLETNGYIVTDNNVDINPLNVNSGERFWNFAKQMLDEQIMRSFSIPELIWNAGIGSLHTNALGQQQLTILDSSIESISQQIKNVMLEKVIRFLIINNFGHQENYGKFDPKPQNDPNQEAVVTSNLITALSTGLVSSNDPEAINSLRRRIQLSPLEDEDLEVQKHLEEQIQALEQKNNELMLQMEELNDEEDTMKMAEQQGY